MCIVSSTSRVLVRFWRTLRQLPYKRDPSEEISRDTEVESVNYDHVLSQVDQPGGHCFPWAHHFSLRLKQVTKRRWAGLA